jgi:hypothetical protein
MVLGVFLKSSHSMVGGTVSNGDGHCRWLIVWTYRAPHEIVGDPRAPTGPGDNDRSSRYGVNPQEWSYNLQTCAATVKVFRYASNTYVVADVGCKFSEVINTASSNNVNLIPGVGATLTIGVGCIMFIIVDHMSNGASHISPEDSERGRAPFNTRERSGG